MKVFTCPEKKCDSNEFVISTIQQTHVDFTREGAVEGHPFITNLSSQGGSVFCYRCQKRIPIDMANEIVAEAI